MRIVNRIEFLKLPSDTLFSTYESDTFGELSIKGDTISFNDFRVQYIADSIACNNSYERDQFLDNAENNPDNFSLNMDFECWSRDGLYEDKQLYAVWDDDDVKALIARLNKVLNK